MDNIYQGNVSFADLISAFNYQVQQCPDKVAVKYLQHSLSYQQLDLLSDSFAEYLKKAHSQSLEGEMAVIAMERSHWMIIAILAVLKTGMAYVPFDPSHPDERLHYILQDCQAGLVITQSAYQGRQTDYPEVCFDEQMLMSLGQPYCSEPHNPLAYVMYTSGSTGQPKGVLVPQTGILRLVLNAHPFQFSTEAVIAQCGNSAFDASTFEIWGALLNGATLVVIPYDTVIDSVHLPQQLREHGVTDAFFTVALFNQLVAENPDVFGELDNVFVGGDALSPSSVKSVMQATMPPGAILNCYGPTENTVFTTVHRITLEDCERTAIPIGKAVSGTQCYVLDEQLQPVIPGVDGELYTSGLGLAVGYLHKPDKTAKAFLPNPFYADEQRHLPASASTMMYKTGDRVRELPDGSLDFIGRTDDQVKIRGFRLELGEVEHRLCQLPTVELAVVQARSYQGQKQLVAWCVGEGKADAILMQFRQQVPAYMVPSNLQMLESLPLNASGKVDKKHLPEPVFVEEEYQVPQTSTEWFLATLWQQLLQLPQPVGRNGHFFALGGHSLLVVRVKQAVESQWHKIVTIADLFRLPELAELASWLDASPIVASSQDVVIVSHTQPGQRIPLSYEQCRLWLISKNNPDSTEYSIPAAYRLSGDFEPQRLEYALQQLIARHDSLRLRIREQNGEAYQQVVDANFDLPVIRCANEQQLQQALWQSVLQPFDLANEPLLRVRLYQCREQQWVLLINIHHIISDGWSMGVFHRELSELYAQQVPLAPLSLQFSDYCCWQQQQDYQADLAYWQQQLQDVKPLALPLSGQARSGSKKQTITLSAAWRTQLQEQANLMGTGLFNLLYSGLALLLARYCGQSDIPIASIWANRPQQALAEQIGFFANTLILRSQVDQQQSLAELLSKNHPLLLEAFEHGSAPLAEVLAGLDIPRHSGQHPLCAVLLVLQNTEGGDGKGLQLAQTEIESYPLPAEPAKSDLLINIVLQTDGGMAIEASFREGVWPKALADQLLGHYRNILQGFGSLSASLLQIPLLDDAQRQKQLLSWNPAVVEISQDSVIALFKRQVELRPNAQALGFMQQRLSYQQLDELSDTLAWQLRRQFGSMEGRCVLFALERSADMVALILAIMKTGAIYVPFDPAHPDERLHYVLEDCAALCLITQHQQRGRQTYCPEVYLEDLLMVEAVGAYPCVTTAPEDIAYVMYTSGSTGLPKGVQIRQQGIIRLVVDAAPYQVTADAVMAQAGNIAFDASTLEIWGALLNGARLEIIPYQTVINSEALPKFLRERGITDAWFTVALFNQLAVENPNAFGGLHHLLIGGDALNPELVASVLRSNTPPRQIWNGYGPTENTTFTTLHSITLADCSGASIPIGKPISGTCCYVLDEYQQLLPQGIIGELYTSGLGLAAGYLNQAEKTAEAFVSNPYWYETHANLSTEEVMYRTGDRVRWHENGTLEFIGRVDNQVKIRGYRLELGEVEHRLCQLEGVEQAVVLAQEHEGQKQLVAWCVSSLPRSQILRDFRQQVPAYMVPTSLQVLDKLPLTANGKVDKRSLPSADFGTTSELAMPPVTTTECSLAEIWQQLLNRSIVINRDDNFFDIGGHSLLVIKMTDMIAKRLGKNIEVATVFNAGTLAELARLIDGGESRGNNEEALLIEQDQQLPVLSFISAPKVAFDKVLLTGVSGFLGIHLLVELQQKLLESVVYCLVRAESEEQGLARLCSAAARYQLTLDEERIRIVLGDLNQPRLGIESLQWQQLATEVDAIYHCGAWVNHLHNYTTLRQANVQSTRDLLVFCCQGRAKQLFYISTLSAAAQRGDLVLENTIASELAMANGYVQGKWVSERLMEQAFTQGLYGAIYRMGNITGSTRHGSSNVETNHTLNLIKGCLQQGVAPDWQGYGLDISPVDSLAYLVVRASIYSQRFNQPTNLGYLATVPWRKLLEQVAAVTGHSLRFVSSEVWAKQWVPQITSDNALYPFKSFYLEPQQHQQSEIEQELVVGANLTFELESLLTTYCGYWLQSGFLNREEGAITY